MIYNLFTKFEFKDIRINGSAKNSPHLYPKIQGFEGVFERRLYSFLQNGLVRNISPPISIKMAFWQPSKKHLSPIPIKMAFCTPYFEKYSPFVYRCPHLIARGKPKVHPLLKKYLSPIRTKNNRFIGLSSICFHYVYILGALSFI